MPRICLGDWWRAWSVRQRGGRWLGRDSGRGGRDLFGFPRWRRFGLIDSWWCLVRRGRGGRDLVTFPHRRGFALVDSWRLVNWLDGHGRGIMRCLVRYRGLRRGPVGCPGVRGSPIGCGDLGGQRLVSRLGRRGRRRRRRWAQSRQLAHWYSWGCVVHGRVGHLSRRHVCVGGPSVRSGSRDPRAGARP